MAEQLILATLTLLLGFPLFLIFILIIIPASCGKSLGIRRLYVKILLNIFEFGQKKLIEAHTVKKNARPIQIKLGGDVSSEDEAGGGDTKCEPDDVFEVTKKKSPHHIALAGTAPEGRQTKLLSYNRSFNTMKKEFELEDITYFTKNGIEAIIDDEVTKRFTTEELSSWNLLTRTNQSYQYISIKLTVLWGVGLLFRYCFLLPLRLVLAIIGLLWLVISTALIGYLPKSKFKQWFNNKISLMTFRILCRSFSAIVNYHHREHMAKGGGICVANHTSPIDVIILGCDNPYAMIGQNHGGFTGMVQRAMNRATDHIWFERSEMRDRISVSRRLREHVEDPSKLPILIFPEGTCINNTSVMMFKKGSFEIGGTIYPVAIKYDPRFGDPFWNSSKQNMIQYLLMMMSSWAIVCDVWYLPPMQQKDGEDAVTFANRVKSEIAKKGGLLDLVWDGQLKRQRVKSTLREKKQEEYSKLILYPSSVYVERQ